MHIKSIISVRINITIYNYSFSIMELENARDDLMFEVHKLNSDRREYDKNVNSIKIYIIFKFLVAENLFF